MLVKNRTKIMQIKQHISVNDDVSCFWWFMWHWWRQSIET